MSGSALAFSSGEQLVTHPVGEGLAGEVSGSDEGRVFVVAGSEAFDVAAGVVESGSAHRCHVLRIAATESLDNGQICGHNKSMANTQIIGKCSNGHTVRGEIQMGRTVGTNGAVAVAPDAIKCSCGQIAGFRYMKVTVVADKDCNGICMAATGPSCSCSCGGHNHGTAKVA